MNASLGAALLAGSAWLGVGGLVLGALRQHASRMASAHLSGASASASVTSPPWFERAIDAVLPGVDVALAWHAAIVALAAAAVGLAVVAPAVAGVLLALGLGGWLVAARLGRRRSISPEAYRAHLLACLTDVHASLSSGSALGPSLTRAGLRPGPCAADLAEVDGELRSGCAVQLAVDRWAARRPGTGVDLVADALAIAGTTGASQVAAVGAVTATLRRRQALAREARALASQAQASAAVLVTLPVGFAVVVAVLDDRVGAFLLGTVAGWACLIGGLALDAAGAWWMAALVRRVR